MADRRSWPERAAVAGWAGLGSALGLAAPLLLRRRLAKGREMPGRWREKLGIPTLPRPEGRLVWLHGVGLGEVMALRGLVQALARHDPGLRFLFTSSTRASAEVLAKNLPAGSLHQFLPLDAPRFWRRFLNHWRPDLVIWSEQDIWPGGLLAVARHGAPQALVNARITAQSFAKRHRLGALYRAAFRGLAVIAAQEQASANRLAALGAKAVSVTGSLKPAAPPLDVDEKALAELQHRLAGRRVLVAASTHPGDEAELIAALPAMPADWLVILAPRDISRGAEIGQALRAAGLSFVARSAKALPGLATRVWLADSFGELGLWFRLADLALIGGGFDEIGGHNPWEAVQLGVPVLFGPDTHNFGPDYALLTEAGAALCLAPGALARSLPAADEGRAMAARAEELVVQASAGVDALASRLCALIERRA